jgi:hypothetical protein
VNHPHRNAPFTLAERKKLLIAQGAAFRSEIVHSKYAAQAHLHPESLATGVAHQLVTFLLSALGNRSGAGLAGIDLQTILPLAISGIAALSKRRSLWKPMAIGILTAGTLGAVVAFVVRKKKAHAYTDDNDARQAQSI